ncbi:lipid A deacylase LpxR family protein [Helicobacter bizzozeronii]|uniref:lipid A deacylase LpxR family protein n=1 Tax=Helicobacter bizzozeronii TaxID=56877 RepID=UPI0018F81A63|nr:lipid A deacylase LpxR family protein [Helicobacter bizzozeronii]
MRSFSLPFCVLLCSVKATSLTPYHKQYIELVTENDGYINPYIDRYYTAGTRIGWVSKEYNFQKKSPMSWARFVSLQGKKERMTRFNIYLTQDMYTPTLAHRLLTEIVKGDHLYGGWLRLNFGIFQRSAHALEHFSISVGMVGPASLAEQTQNLIHTWAHDPKFLGWHNQIKNEFIFQINYTWIQKLDFYKSRFFSIDMLPGAGLQLGNALTNFKIGAMLRMGYNLEADFGPNSIHSAFAGGMPYSSRFSFYLFAGATGLFQPLDVFVQGNDPQTRHQTQLPYFLYNAQVGVAIAYKGWRFSFSAIDWSKTFREQPRNHNIGSIELDIAF